MRITYEEFFKDPKKYITIAETQEAAEHFRKKLMEIARQKWESH